MEGTKNLIITTTKVSLCMKKIHHSVTKKMEERNTKVLLWETTGCIFLKIFCQKLIFILSTMAFSNPHSWMKGFVVEENIVILK
jgi:hypothetical protein